MKDQPFELEHIVEDEYLEHDVENEFLHKIEGGIDYGMENNREIELLEIEQAIEKIQSPDKGIDVDRPEIIDAPSDLKILYEHPVDYPEIIYDDKDRFKYKG
jgi:hypothetical protein